ncbi:MAG TPA: hypothetical protein VE732_04150, partial [Nitrososphaera sp.]|nr:hypothetical protein [Nitrososphaera sp.]
MIRHRYEEHTRRKFLLKIEAAVSAILIESPPQPLYAALERIGVSDGTLRKYFPKEHKAISARYLKFRQEQSMKNKENDRVTIRSIIMDLIKRGIYPS